MGEDKAERKDNLGEDQREAVENMHKTFLEALRHREQEILRYIAILAPALGGFVWLLNKVDVKSENGLFIFTVGTLGILLLLFVGAMYSLTLGYNFRYVTLQLAKMESGFCLNIKEFILESWLRTATEWVEKYKKKRCSPPEIINVFWLSFIIAKIFVLLMSIIFLIINQKNTWIQMWLPILFISVIGLICVIVAWWCAPSYYGKRLYKMCKEEKKANKW